MSGFQPRDSRGFFMLPQSPQDAGYYVYGTPDHGRAQYAHARMISLILAVEREWQLTEKRRFGVGNICQAEGVPFGHDSHKNGLQVDIRPLRTDGKEDVCFYTYPEYDRAGTEKLIETWRRCFPGQLTIFFNDNRIPGVRPLVKHDNHFHVQFK